MILENGFLICCIAFLIAVNVYDEVRCNKDFK